MRKLHKKPLIMAAATLALTATLAVGSAMAYFTTYSTAGGGVKMNMGFTETVPKEEVDKDGKHITIENTGDYNCFVRVKAFAPVEVGLTYNAPYGGWTAGDEGYWYYDDVLPAGKTTEQELNITYKFPEGNDKPEEFNIVVIQECTPVLYKEDGTPYADWNHVITDDSTQTTE